MEAIQSSPFEYDQSFSKFDTSIIEKEEVQPQQEETKECSNEETEPLLDDTVVTENEETKPNFTVNTLNVRLDESPSKTSISAKETPPAKKDQKQLGIETDFIAE